MNEVILRRSAFTAMPAKCRRYALIAFGWLCVAIGLVGVVVPGLPTTIFMILAAWAFSKSSERFQAWLLGHPRFGPAILAWRENGAVSRRAKALALVTMTFSLAVISVFVATSWVLPAVVGGIMLCVGAYIVTRPSV
jgi:uncharacterized membrane protein YbaN (DUF454 family)